MPTLGKVEQVMRVVWNRLGRESRDCRPQLLAESTASKPEGHERHNHNESQSRSRRKQHPPGRQHSRKNKQNGSHQDLNLQPTREAALHRRVVVPFIAQPEPPERTPPPDEHAGIGRQRQGVRTARAHLQQYGSTSVRQYGDEAVQQYGGTVVKQYCSTVGRCTRAAADGGWRLVASMRSLGMGAQTWAVGRLRFSIQSAWICNDS